MHPRSTNISTQTRDVHRFGFEPTGALELDNEYSGLNGHFCPKTEQVLEVLERLFTIDIESCPECGCTLRVIAAIEDPPLIRKILEHVQRHEALISRLPRAPPDSHPDLNLT